MTKPYHMAAQVDDAGDVSPLCAARPRALDLSRSSWTSRWEAVTCPKCLARKPEGAVSAWDRPAKEIA